MLFKRPRANALKKEFSGVGQGMLAKRLMLVVHHIAYTNKPGLHGEGLATLYVA